jgi:streptomycin 6-kinase
MPHLPPIPAPFRERTLKREGGAAWLDAVPGRVERLCQQWNLSLGHDVWHGEWGLVFPIWRAEQAYVLKLNWPGSPTALDAAALRAWNGRGAVRLGAVDDGLDALLLEQLDATRTLAVLPVWEALEVGGSLIRTLAIPAPPALLNWPEPSPHPLRLAPHALTLAETLPRDWQAAGRPFSRQTLERVCALALQLGQSQTLQLVHGDLHPANILAGVREPWQAIDPRVHIGDAEYGVVALLLRHTDALQWMGQDARAGLRAVVRAGHLDPEVAQAWAYVRTAEYWLWGVQHGLTEDPVRCAWLMESLSSTPD